MRAINPAAAFSGSIPCRPVISVATIPGCSNATAIKGIYCDGCGRTHQEIDAMRKPVEKLVKLAEKMKYDNLEDFANAVAGSIKYKMGAGH
jgi:hypothetical protein